MICPKTSWDGFVPKHVRVLFPFLVPLISSKIVVILGVMVDVKFFKSVAPTAMVDAGTKTQLKRSFYFFKLSTFPYIRKRM